MTRGTIAFVNYDKTYDHYILFTTKEFNGDMAPDMESGKKLIQAFKDVYFNKYAHESKYDKMRAIEEQMRKEFCYDSYTIRTPFYIERNKNGEFLLDLATVQDKDGRTNYDTDPWSKYFNYSDWVYIVDISDKGDFYIINSDIDNDKKIHLSSSCVEMFYFREWVYTFEWNGTDGVFIRRNSDFDNIEGNFHEFEDDIDSAKEEYLKIMS